MFTQVVAVTFLNPGLQTHVNLRHPLLPSGVVSTHVDRTSHPDVPRAHSSISVQPVGPTPSPLYPSRHPEQLRDPIKLIQVDIAWQPPLDVAHSFKSALHCNPSHTVSRVKHSDGAKKWSRQQTYGRSSVAGVARAVSSATTSHDTRCSTGRGATAIEDSGTSVNELRTGCGARLPRRSDGRVLYHPRPTLITPSVFA